MNPFEIVAIVAIAAYAVFRQSRRHEVVGATRFKMAIIYVVVGLAFGGFHLPSTSSAITGAVVGLGLSAVIGVVRGRYTRVWPDGGRVYAQGTALTIGLFLALFVVKFAFGTVDYLSHGGGAGNDNGGGFGSILVMVAIMVAMQAEIVWRRAKPLGARSSERETAVPVN